MPPESAENPVKKRKPSARRELVIDAIAAGLPIIRAAEMTGVARRTVYYWLEDPDFREALECRRRELRDQIASEVADLGVACIATVKDYLGGDDSKGYGSEPAKVKLAVGLMEKLGLIGGKPVPPTPKDKT